MAQRKKVKPKTWTAYVVCEADAEFKKKADALAKKILNYLNKKAK